MQYLKIFCFGFLYVFSMVIKGQTLGSYRSYPIDKSTYREHPVDFKHVKLDVSFVPDSGLVYGKVTHTFTPLQEVVDSVFLDAPGIQIYSVKMNQSDLNFTTKPEGVIVYFSDVKINIGNEYSFTIDYKAKPARGIYFMGWNHPEDLSHQGEWGHTRPQIWTQGQGIDNRHWIPCFDATNDKVTTDITVHFPGEYQVLSNGVFKYSVKGPDGQMVWNYVMNKPHAPYLIMLAIGKYNVKKSQSTRKVPVNFWYYPEFPHRMEPTSLYTEKMVDFMEKELNFNYPWEQYSQVMVQNFLYGAMENTSATIFGDFFAIDQNTFPEYNYVSVNMHEFTHQWFGDFVTARHAPHHWLQESFATHYPKYFEKQYFGDDHFQFIRLKEQQTALEASKKDQMPVAHSETNTPRVYQKGSQVLDMLRYVLGNEAYRRVITYYLKNHAYANVETNDLHQAVQDVTGRNLDWFFDQWLYRGGEPKYAIRWEPMQKDGKNYTFLQVNQVHEVSDIIGYFKMPIAVHVYYQDGTVDSMTQWVEGAKTEFRIINPQSKKVKFVVFDPGARVLKSVVYPRSWEELSAQAQQAREMADRYEAIYAMRDLPLPKKSILFSEILSNENFWGIRAEIFNQIPKTQAFLHQGLVRLGLMDKHIKVRLAAMQVIPESGAEWLSELALVMSDSSYDLRAQALKKACFQQPKHWTDTWKKMALPLAEGKAIGNFDRVTYYQVLASVSQGEVRKAALDTLIRLASPRFEFRTRGRAFLALKELDYFSEDVMVNLAEAMSSWNGRLAGPAKETMNHYLTRYENRELVRKWIMKDDKFTTLLEGMVK